MNICLYTCMPGYLSQTVTVHFSNLIPLFNVQNDQNLSFVNPGK